MNLNILIPTFDRGAANFINAASITDDTQRRAVNFLAKRIRRIGWGRFDALYPFVGGNASAHSFNLIDPTQFQISWSGTILHDSNGITGNGSNGYGNSGLNPRTVSSVSDFSVSAYKRTSGANVALVGANDSAVNYTTISNGGSNVSRIATTTAESVSSGTFDVGLGTAQCGSNRVNTLSINGAVAVTGNAGSALHPNRALLILARSNNGTVANYSPSNLSLISIGKFRTSTQETDFYRAVQQYQTILGRAV